MLFWLIGGAFHFVDAPRGPWYGGPPIGPIVLVLGLFALFRILRALRRTAVPIADLMDAAHHISDGHYDVRVPERGPSEVRQLARAFNSMAARLAASDAERRGLLADVTHELRTPLTVIQGNIEALMDGLYPADDAHLTPILEETRVLSRLIDDLRTLSLAEAGALKLQKEATDLAALAGEVVASFRTKADAAGIALDTESAPGLPILQLDPARIREVLENLLSNSFRHTPSGGSISVRTTSEAPERSVLLSVADTGRGIAPDELPHIFERLYRGSESPGMGLGLAIAKDLVEAHGGPIRARSEAGKGTTVECLFPATPLL